GDAGFELGSEMSSLSFHMSDFGVICPSQTSQSFNKTLAPFCGTTSKLLENKQVDQPQPLLAGIKNEFSRNTP
ncbi:MAG: hypothetical protein ACK5RZ_03610, partial [Akkermansiaceae bacterium]